MAYLVSNEVTIYDKNAIAMTMANGDNVNVYFINGIPALSVKSDDGVTRIVNGNSNLKIVTKSEYNITMHDDCMVLKTYDFIPKRCKYEIEDQYAVADISKGIEIELDDEDDCDSDVIKIIYYNNEIHIKYEDWWHRKYVITIPVDSIECLCKDVFITKYIQLYFKSVKDKIEVIAYKY